MAIIGQKLPSNRGGVIIRINPVYFSYDNIAEIRLYNTETSFAEPLYLYSYSTNPTSNPLINSGEIFTIKIPAQDCYVGTMFLYIQDEDGSNEQELTIEFLGSDYNYSTWQLYDYIHNV